MRFQGTALLALPVALATLTGCSARRVTIEASPSGYVLEGALSVRVTGDRLVVGHERETTFVTLPLDGTSSTRVSEYEILGPGHAGRRLSAGVRETIRARPAGVEQSWHFDAPPSDGGPIRVRIETTAQFAAASAGALSFVNGPQERLTYSEAHWIDADGERWEIPSRWVDGGIELIVPAVVLASSRFPCVLDPMIGLEHAVLEPRLSPRTSTNGAPYVLWSGTDFVVFVDGRVTHVAPDGTVLYPGRAWGPSPPCGRPTFGRHRGAGYDLVCTGSTGLSVLRTDEDFETTSRVDIAASSTSFVAAGPDLLLVLDWADRSTIRGYIVNPSSREVVGPLEVATGPGSRGSAVAAWTGSTFVVAYTDDRYTDASSPDIRSTTVTLTGAVSSVDGVVVAGSPTTFEEAPALVSSPTQTLLAWGERPGASSRTCTTVTRLVDLDGTVSAVTAGTRSGDPCGTVGAVPGVWTGSEWLVYRGGSTFQRFTPGVATGAPYVVPGPGTTTSIPVAWGTSSGLAAYPVGAGFGRAYAYSRTLGATGPTGEPQALIVTEPNVASVELDSRSGLGWMARAVRLAEVGIDEIRARRVGATGEPVGDSFVTPAPTSIAAGPDRWLLASRTTTAVELRWLDARVNTVGAVSATLPMLELTSDTALTAGDGGFLWSEGRSSGLRVSRIRADGTLADPTPATLTTQFPAELAAAGVASTVLVVWNDGRGADLDVFAARVDLATGIVDRSAIQLSSGGGHDRSPIVARCGTGWLVAWTLEAGGFAYRLISATGSTQPVVMHASTTRMVGLAAAWDGARTYLLRREGSPLTYYGIAVSPDGSETPDVALWSGPVGIRDVLALDSIGSGQFVAAYSAFDPWTESDRLFARSISIDTELAALGTTCVTSASCASGHCVDGVCCESSCGSATDDCVACSRAAGGLIDGVCGRLASTHVCRPATAGCDTAELCDGIGAACPPDLRTADGSPCGVDARCNEPGICMEGSCLAGSPVSCDDGDSCTTDTCDEATGCVHTGSSCLDARLLDGGPPVDAGSGPGDGAVDDSGSTAGSFDVSTPLDAATGSPAHGTSGCACAAPAPGDHGSRASLFLAIFGGALITRRRTQRPPAPRTPG